MPKHYVLALERAFADKTLHDAGAIVSIHNDFQVARDRAERFNKQAGIWRKPAFAPITSDDTLEKGVLYPALVEKWRADKFEADAIHTMKAVLDPSWRGGKPIDNATIAAWLEELGLSLDALRDRFGERAQAELDAAAVNRVEQAEKHARAMAVTRQLDAQRSEITYSFPAVRGIQAGRAYYAAQIPYGALVKLFVFDDEDVVPAEHRAQRQLNERRAAAIGEYVVENPSDYILPALTASVSAEMAFEPITIPGATDRLGMLHIPVEATLLINDGQHRRKGIELALASKPYLRDETVTVTIFFDQGLERSQQMFADINGKQVKPSNAINALYDRRSPFNAWTLSILDLLPEVSQRIDFENSSVGAKSYKLWSLIVFKKFLSLLTGVTEKNIDQVPVERLVEIDTFVAQFFNECREFIPHWAEMIDGKIAAVDVRENLVIGHAVWLEALAIFARRALFTGYIIDHGAPEEGVINPAIALWERMSSLANVVPTKNAAMWDGRCVVLGKMQKTADGVKSTAAQLLKLANVPLAEGMQQLEIRLAA